MGLISRIRRDLKALEAEVALLEELRELAKTEAGHFSEFGRLILQGGKEAEVKQAFLAKLLEVTPGAVSRQYAKV